ncbi:MYXO-CTERM sorting domain-containing protein [Myxococcota bacterium]|nr:MYXO-CTERM sorting domain-containing protein [Myxococcota bacterium]
MRSAPTVTALAVTFVIASQSTAMAQAVPYTSFRKLVTSNGFAPAVYDLESRRIVSFREHLYRTPTSTTQTRELAYDVYLGLRVDGASRWLTDVPLDEAGYEPGTGLIRTVQSERGIRVTTTWTSPFLLDAPALVVVAELENVGADTRDVALFSLHNFHVGGGSGTQNERVRWDAALGAYLESSTLSSAPRGVLVAKPLTPATRHTASPDNPYPRVTANELFSDVDDSTELDDVVSGFQLDVNGRGAFPRGAKVSFAIVFAWAPDRDAAAMVAKIDAWAAGKSPEALLEAERAGWRAWHAQGLWPVTRSDAEDRIARQSVAMLRMGQVREPGTPHGQIVASLPPGRWDITWLRDGLFAVEALTRTGHHDEARAALDFLKRGPFGEYESYVGMPYGLSITRYYGDGEEESDWNNSGPNIELDGFGMYLEAAALHVAESGDTAWFTANRAHVDGLVADVLVRYRDEETRLVAGDSSIWETHWRNGGRQRWSFTSGRAVRGLADWASTIERVAGPNDPKIAEYRTAASEIEAAMRTHLVDATSGALASSVEQLRGSGGRFADVQTAFVMRPDTIDPASPLGLATLDFLRARLFLASTTARGYKRNDDGGSYDEREWVVADLLVSQALRSAGRADEADALVDWVTSLADANFLIVPELLDQTTAAYVGEIPMIGFGAGAYVLSLVHRSGTRVPFPEDGTDGGVRTDAGPASGDSGLHADATIPEDAGIGPSTDAATSNDAATARPDAGPATKQSEGCGCSTSAATHGSSAFAALGALIGALLFSRRGRWGR